MITAADLAKIHSLTQSYWDDVLKTDEFRSLFKGKEIGHRIADFVDEHTTAMLQKHFPVGHEVHANDKPRARSMGDVWIRSLGMYNPVNVKSGEAGKNGQPNMVSLSKLLEAVLEYKIDSYYLLIVKMRLSSVPASADVSIALTPDEIVAEVYLVDMLDYLDYITFDSGPGQAMLKEKQFYMSFENKVTPPVRDLAEKVSQMIDLFEDGNRRLLDNRKTKLDRIRIKFRLYQAKGEHVVNQKDMRFG